MRQRTLSVTQADRYAMTQVRETIAALKQDSQKFIDANPDFLTHEGKTPTVSEWQFQATVETRSGVKHGRINRLVSLTLLEQKPSDGFGPQIRIKTT